MIVEAVKEADTTVDSPSDWVLEVAQLEEKFCKEIRKVDASEAIQNLTRSYPAAYYAIKPYLEQYLNPKVLEVGTGYGFGLCYLHKLGIDATGIEPGAGINGFEGRYSQAIRLLEANGLKNPSEFLYPAVGESLPFPDNTFDIVYSLDVLEHVKDVEGCLAEAYRVVKPGGIIKMAVPNYNGLREQHYNVFWLPHLLKSKAVAKWYVKTFFGRKDWFIDELNFVTANYFKKLLGRMPQMKDMKIHFYVDQSVPRLSPIASRIADTYYGAQTRTFRGKVKKFGYGVLLDIVQNLGLVAILSLEMHPVKKP
ncbi:MAG: class I SAM-dependent methyltransferase [Leptolyngbya sp.]|nr:class I SAM-dependent methyltransferase [Candidatus Melainabacteria bacterium]